MNRMTRNRTLIAIALAGVLGSAAFAASAQTADAPAQAQTAPANAEAQAAADAQQQPRIDDSKCLRETGSRIRSADRKSRCADVGRAYDRDTLESTGRTNLADALRAVDPSVH